MMTVARRKLDIPQRVSGRIVTNRGVHLQPFGYHGDWLDRASYWVDLLSSMGMSWVVILNHHGGSVRQKYHGLNPLEVLLDAGIIPIIREAERFPRPFTAEDTVLWSIELYGQYGLKPFWVIRNEPFDEREWVDRTVPPDAWQTVLSIWADAAQFIAGKGGYVGFPDGPCYQFNPFESLKEYDCQWIFDKGWGFYAGHHYGKNRHRDYPYDPVTRYGARLTEEAYLRLLDDFADDPKWREEPIERINQRRDERPQPGLTAIEDDTCWRGWEKIVHWSVSTFGYAVPMAMTEGGWVPRDRPGTGPNTDTRVPHTTPRMVAKKTMQMYDVPSPFFAICPWLLACEDMGGSGWPYDAWHGWAYSELYGSKKPVVTALEQVPPKQLRRRAAPLVIDVEGDTRDWAWVRQASGARYRRGRGSLRLIEVHEYEGPATLDVWVVDGDGLPVAGIPFYYYYPGAPLIQPAKPGTRVQEWYTRGILRTTRADGRISFPVVGEACLPGACTGGIWPLGRGDLLLRLGILAGTRNRHLNGLWQLVEEPSRPQATFHLSQTTSSGDWEQLVGKLEHMEELVSRLP
jgi:hypothetical protein